MFGRGFEFTFTCKFRFGRLRTFAIDTLTRRIDAIGYRTWRSGVKCGQVLELFPVHISSLAEDYLLLLMIFFGCVFRRCGGGFLTLSQEGRRTHDLWSAD